MQRQLDGVHRGRLVECAFEVVDVHLEPAVERLELLDLAEVGDLLGLGGDVRLAAQTDLERRLRALGPAHREPVFVLDDVHGARQGQNRVADGGRSGEEDLKR
jgi:hypothetical protein